MNLLLASTYHISRYYAGNEHYAHHLAQGLIQTTNLHLTYLTSSYSPQRLPLYPIRRAATPHLLGKPLPSPSWISSIRDLDIDIFHACGSGLPLLFLALWFRHFRPSVPRVLTYQADSRPRSLIMNFAVSVESMLIGLAFNHIIATTPAYKTVCRRRWPRARIHRIPLFVSDSFAGFKGSKLASRRQLGLSAKRRYLLFVAKLDSHHYYKGLQVLLDSLSLLDSSLHLIIIGDGGQQAHYQAQALTLGISPRCHFLGAIKHTRLPPYFSAADCLILPSTSNSEGFGMVLFEAMAVGTPVITTSVIGSASWLKRHRVAAVIPPNNPKDLAAAISRIVSSHHSATINRARAFSRQLTLKNLVNQTHAVYMQTLTV